MGLSDGRRGGGLAGASAADDQGEVVATGAGDRRRFALLRELGRAVEGPPLDVAGIES